MQRIWCLSIGMLLCFCFLTDSCKRRNATESDSAELVGSGPELQVARVVLYQNGIGYIERRGKISGDSFELRIRPDQINDILKSLTVIDLSAGRATSVSLPVEKSANRMRQELPKGIYEQGGLLAVLDVFRGANVEIHARGASHEGRLVGIEAFDTTGLPGGGTVQRWRVTVLKGENELMVFDLADIESVTVRDRTLQVGLKKSLDISLEEGQWKPVNLTVRLSEGNGHDVVAAYVVEMPLWKPVYRIVTDASGKPLLQGWAIIDNVSGEEWKGVRLSLVAGTPLSYVYDLHTPQFLARPALQAPHRTVAQAQPVFGSGSAAPGGVAGAFDSSAREGLIDDLSPAKDEESPLERARRQMAPSASAAAVTKTLGKADKGGGSGGKYQAFAEEEKKEEPAKPMAPPPPPLSPAQMESSVQTLVAGAAVGTLFRYDLEMPVTVPDRSSSLVSIINARVPGETVHLFRPNDYRNFKGLNPYRAVRFQNATKFTLEEGPITIFSEGTFVGEGYLARTDPEQSSFVTFALDPSISLEANSDEKETGMRLLKIVDGMVWSEVMHTQDIRYRANNELAEAAMVYVKIDKIAGWDVKQPTEGVIATGGAWFVPHKVPPKKQEEWHVVLGSPLQKQLAITTDLATTVLRLYMDGSQADQKIKPQLRRILDIKTHLAELAAESTKLRGQQSDLEQEQNRIREDLYVLSEAKGSAALKNQLKEKLEQVGNQLSQVTSRLVELRQKDAELQTEMRMILRDLTLDATPPGTTPPKP